MKILVRKKLYGNGIIMLQRKFYVLFLFPIWRDWKPMNNQLHDQDSKIVKLVEKLQKEVDHRKAIDSMLKAEVKEMNGRYLSEPIPYDTNEFWFNKHSQLAPVDGKLWRYLISPKILGDKPQGIREQMGLEPRKSNRSAYTLKDFEPFKLALESDDDFDTVLSYREPNNGNQGKSKSPRKKQPGESDEEHRARLKQMESDNF